MISRHPDTKRGLLEELPLFRGASVDWPANMHYLLELALILLSWLLPVVGRVQQACQTVIDCFETVSQKAVSKAQAVVTFVKGLPKALQNTVSSWLGHRTTESLWVCGSNMISRLIQWSAVMCLLAIVALVLFPVACACVLTAVAAAYLEMGWVFWLLLLDLMSIAVVCTYWCQWCFHALSDAPGRIWSTTSSRLGKAVSSFQRHIKSCLSKVTAYFELTTSNAMRSLIALVRWLMVYPLVLLAKVGCLLLPSFHTPLPGMLL